MSVYEEALEMDPISVFGTTKAPRHSPPALLRVHLLGQSIHLAIARLHASLTGAAMGVAPAVPAQITINDGRGDTQYVTSNVMLDGWYLVESSDTHAPPEAPKGFYLLPLAQTDLNRHDGRLPYLEFVASGFAERYLSNKAQARKVRLYVLDQLLIAMKDEEPLDDELATAQVTTTKPM